jgi:eukaryotic-like serine/threonine-protein kinase
MTPERVGTVIAGKYRVQEVLGRGGMGDVYSGIDEELGGRVAVKFLHRMFGNDSDLRARFRREAQALSRLRHPGIVSLLQFGEHEEELFVVMELVTGKALSDLLDEAPLSVPFVATVFSELFEILEFAHEAGVVHRDVKPSNVMVLPGNRVKLIDFGLARLPETQEKLTRAGVVHGTPEYMSPEQALGENVEAPGDIYSTGVLLYECLAGDGPFEGGSAAMLMSQHLFGDPPARHS